MLTFLFELQNQDTIYHKNYIKF